MSVCLVNFIQWSSSPGEVQSNRLEEEAPPGVLTMLRSCVNL